MRVWLIRCMIIPAILVLMMSIGCEKGGKKGEDVVTVKVALLDPPARLNPIICNDASSLEVVDVLYRGFVSWNENWKLYPLTAREIPTMANGGITKKGKQGASLLLSIDGSSRWSNGIYLTSNDFIFYYQMAVFPGIGNAPGEWVSHIKSLSTAGNDKLSVIWKGFDLGYLTYFKALPRAAIEADAMKNPRSFFNEPVKWQKVVNGPYEVKDPRIKKERIYSLKLVTNPEYSRKKPAIPAFLFTFFSTREAFESDIFSGKVDVIPILTFEEGKVLSENKDFNTFFTPSDNLIAAFFDTQSELLGDKGVRKALCLSVNRGEISKSIYEGKGKVADSFLPPQHPAYLPVFAKLAFNQKEAIELLRSSGWKKESGQIWMKGDKKLSLSIFYSDDPLQEKCARSLKESWERLGVEVKEIKVEKKDFYETLTTMQADKHYPQVIVGNIRVSPWIEPRYLFSEKYVPSLRRMEKCLNYSRWSSPESEVFCQACYEELDSEKKKELIQQLQAMAGEEIPLIPLTFELKVSACRKSIKNFKPRGFGNNTWNIEYWEMEGVSTIPEGTKGKQ